MSRNEEDKFDDARTNAERVSTPPSELFRVGVKSPPFWPQDPSIWFKQIEGQFALSNITVDDTKYYYVLSQLDQQYVAEIKDVIMAPPAKNKYEKLKTELIKRLSASRENEVKQLLIHEELGDRKPSQFMRHLQHLAGPDIPQEFLKTIWTSRLPRHIQTVIAAQPDASLEVLSNVADRVQEIVPSGAQQVASTSASSPMEVMALQIAALTKQVQDLTTHVLKRDSRGRSRSRSRSRYDPQRRRSSSRSQASYNKYPNCWYHSKFGANANKCVKPCNFHAGNSHGNR